MVVGAIRGEVLQIKNLSHADADHGITIQCQGWLATSDSFGRTSQPQVSAQIAAMSARRIQSAVSNLSLALSRPHSRPITGAEAAFHVPVRTMTNRRALSQHPDRGTFSSSAVPIP